MESSHALLSHLEKAKELSKENIVLDEAILKVAYNQMKEDFDDIYGGFGNAPKFPPTMSLQVLLRTYRRTGDKEALSMVEQTLDQMARGGMNDHLGGGFHRYATDNKWFMPHFEKMLYTNALMAGVYMETYQVTQKPVYAMIAKEILDYVLRDMTGSGGGFYSAEDADSEGEEGKFYVWTYEEIKGALSEKEFELFRKAYGVAQAGNTREGTHVLSLQPDINWETISNPLIQSARKKLFAHREKRVHPIKDDKILTAWNGLMIASMAKASRVFGDKKYLSAAQKAASFIKKKLYKSSELSRRFRDGETRFAGVLDDYAYLIFGLIQLYEADFDADWIAWARKLQETQDTFFWDQAVGAYIYSKEKDPSFIQSLVEFQDGAKPNANAISILNLLKLYDLVFDKTYKEKVQALLLANAGRLKAVPQAFTQQLIALDYYLDRSKEIAIIGDMRDDRTQSVLAWINTSFLPNITLAFNNHNSKSPFTLLNQKKMINNQTTVYVCENNVCFLPTSDLEKVKALVLKNKPYTLAD